MAGSCGPWLLVRGRGILIGSSGTFWWFSVSQHHWLRDNEWEITQVPKVQEMLMQQQSRCQLKFKWLQGLVCASTTAEEFLDIPGHSPWWDTWTKSHPFRTLGCVLHLSAMFRDVVQNASESSLCFNFLPFGEVRPVSDSLRDYCALNISCSPQSQLAGLREVSQREPKHGNAKQTKNHQGLLCCRTDLLIYLFKVLSYDNFIWSWQKFSQTSREGTGTESQGELLTQGHSAR